ncbi:MAG: choice-of-anchor B family protein [Ardenticatenaceae bacterium]
MNSVWKIVGSLLIVYIIGLVLFLPATNAASSARVALEEGEEQDVFVSEPVVPGVSSAVRDLQAPERDPVLDREINPRKNPDFLDGVGENIVGPIDALREASRRNSGRTPSPILNFEGQGVNGGTPPDMVGDVGPTHYVQMVNVTFAMYDKSGNQVQAPRQINQLWEGSSGQSVCEQQNAGDPIVLHDQLADRWLLSQFASPNHICVAISQSADPTGAYYTYQFDVGAFPDYFKFGVWPDGYYMTANEGGSNNYTAYAFDRSNMLAGQAATFQKVTGQTNLMLPSDLDGTTLPPADSPNYFYTFKDNNYHGVANDQLEVRAFDVDWTTPANSSFTLVATIPITSFTYSVCGHFNFDCVPQAGTSQKLDSVSEWPMWRAPYRNFGTHEALVGNFAVDVGNDQAGIRWFELRKSGSGAWALHQEGTHAPDSHHRWMGSMAMDQSGNIGLGYSVSSNTLNPQIRYTTRLSSDAAGTLGAEETLIAGSGSQTSINRWGDYSSLNVDPSDDCTFWYTNEYLSASGGSWKTRIGTFKVPSCGSGTTPTPGPSSTPLPGTPTVIPTPTPSSTPSTSDPQIEVDPSELSSTQPAGVQASEIFSLRNTGAQNLTWTIQEDEQRGAASIESINEPSEQMSPQEQTAKRQALQEAFLADREPAQDLDAMPATPCVAGDAGGYPCKNVDLLAFMPLAQIGGGEGNDIWGWTDPETGKEYAIMGRTSGTSFVDISNPENPIYLGNLPAHTANSSWRDLKVYNNHAFIVSEASNHGMQIFDLTELRDVSNPPVPFSNTAHYGDFGNAHNIVINEESGFAYAVGTGTCSAGLHMVNISTPTNPTNAGCFSSDGYTHDAQCVMYNGPDTAHQGQEICFNSNEDTLTIVDVSNKNSPAQLSRTGYNGSRYTHQGWLTEDHTYFLLDDELDEQGSGHNTRTYIWDVSDLDSPSLIGTYNATTAAIDHNLYIKGQHAYQSNYRAGLRILDVSDISNANLTETAYFDIYPNSDSASFNGTWSNYPYFESGVVIVSGIEQGLFILQPNLDGSPPPPPAEPCETPSDISWASLSPTSGTTAAGSSSSVNVTFDSTGLAIGTYTGTLCINSNDPVTSLLPVPLTLTVSDSSHSQTINLNQGWNKIGLSVEPTSPIMAESLCAEIGNIVEINRWHAGGWDGHICGQTFNNFTLEINNGYFVHSDAVATWSIEGLPINSPTLDLQIGWNSISLPHTDGYTAESLCDEIIDQGVTAVEINRWYAGGWDGHICNQSFNDFAINPGKGYFIKSTSAGPVTPPAVASPSPGQQPSEGLPQVGQAMAIHDLVVSNLRDTSVTLSWTTEEATTGYVRANTGNRLPENQKVALDIRGASTSSKTHVVLLDHLAPETTYQLELISGVDGAETTQITVTTAPTLQTIPSSDTIYGKIFEKADGDEVRPAAGALVYLTIIDTNSAESRGEAKLLSALVDAEGYWHANLGNARTNDLLSSFNYTQGDQLLIEAQAADGRTATKTVDIADDTLAPDITLASAPTAVEVATYDTAPASTPWQAGVLLVTFLLAAAGWSRRKK